MTEQLLEPAALRELHGAVLVITLNRPEALNSVNAALATALSNAIYDAEKDDAVRAIVLTGAGRAFCAGMDLKAFAAGESVASETHPEWGLGGMVEHRVSKPIVAAVNGGAYGLGAELVLASDIVVIDPAARIALPEVTLGLFAAAGGVTRIMQQIPPKIALERLLTGEPITAEEAARWGLANRVSAPGESLTEAIELAERIAKNGPLAVVATKELALTTAQSSSWQRESWHPIAALRDRVFASADALEGATAFTEKRHPIWTGK